MNINIQQLEYVVAVDSYRHFAKAAESCFVTQPTLSMMIQKLEDELNIKIFDRSTHPVEPTPIGRQIIEQARVSLRHFRQIKEIADNERNIVKGSFRLGVIPTIAPYLIPELLEKQNEKRNEISLTLHEYTTVQIVNKLQNGMLDGGLLAGPLHHDRLTEIPVYYEKFYAYVSPKDKTYSEKEVDLNLIDINHIWLLENEHCLRGQIERLCRMKQSVKSASPAVQYKAGSIETLIHVVDHNGGMTIIPEMSAMRLGKGQHLHLRDFKNSPAYREVSLVVSNDYVRKAMLNEVLKIIKSSVPKEMQDMRLKEFVVELV
ncbi:MAG: hydrogen peroxide-inducible genes activator [Tannerella sp.]|jgi:LysR family hydrogen peroxide-inducible transcriptional activator|nr:hydrogen peroxide-inducible genes activator [Tannerella sp.]